MFELLTNSFATLFVVIDPIGLLPMFLAVTAGADAAARRKVAFTSVGLGAIILLSFAIFGDNLLGVLGVSMPAFRIAGGIMLFLIALEMLFEKRTERREKNAQDAADDSMDDQKSSEIQDAAIFPLAIPMIAGPGAIASLILLMSHHGDDVTKQVAIVGVLGVVLLITLLVFLLANPLENIIGKRVTKVFTRLLGIILGAIAVQFVISGISQLSFVQG